MLTRQELIDDIRRGLATMEYYVRPGGAVNLTDANVHAEPFVAGLLNCVYGWGLVSTNDKTANYPCIDLIDERRRLGVQVTSEKGSKKVNDTIECLVKHKLADQVQRLKIFSLIPKLDRYTVKVECPGTEFTWTEDILDFDDVVQKTVSLPDLGHLRRIREFIVASMSSIFSGTTASSLPPGIEATYPHLFTQVRSGNADNVRQLLEAGLSPNIDWNGQRPLGLALSLLDDAPVSRIADHRAVVASLVRAGDPPRELATEVHDAFDHDHVERLIALLLAGVPLDVRSDSGTTLLAKAMRRDDKTHTVPSATLRINDGAVALLLRHGKTLTGELAGWLLRWACLRGHLELVKQLADSDRISATPGGLPDEILLNDEAQFWRPGVTPLHLAAACQVASRPAVIDWLLKHGANCELQDEDGNTPLMVAVSHRSVDSALLLAKVPHQNFFLVNNNGESALSLAVGEPKLVGVLLQAGASVPQSRHRSPLHAAAYKFDADSLALLLAAQTDVNLRNEDGRTPLLEMCCFRYGDSVPDFMKSARSACLQLLLNGDADVRAADTTGWTAIHWLAQTNEVAAAQAVLARNPDVNTADQAGRTPLMICSYPQMIEVLLKHGAHPDVRDKRGHTALAWATMFDREEVAERLRAAHAHSDNLVNAELLLASRNGDVTRLQGLLTAGGDPNSCDGWGCSALELAATHGHANAVEVLLEFGAAHDSRDENGATVLANVLCTNPQLWKADIESLKEIAIQLLDCGARFDTVDSRGNSAAHVGFWWWHFPDLASRLLDACCTAVNLEGATLLMTAVERGSFEHVRYLVEQKQVDVNQKDRKGQNILFRLPDWRSDLLDRARFLIDAGADLECTDVDGRTPLLRAAAAGSLELVRMFVNYGAKLDHQDHAGRTARHHALQNSKVEIVNLLWECERNPDQRRIIS